MGGTGIKITRDKNDEEITIIEVECTQKILKRFEIREYDRDDTLKKTRLLQARKFKRLSQVDLLKNPRWEDVGVSYVWKDTGPGISYSINVLSRFQVQPTT